MSDANGGHVALPRRLPLWPLTAAIIAALTIAFGLGSWAWALETRVDEHDAIIKRVAAYMCMDCAYGKQYDCRFICGTEE